MLLPVGACPEARICSLRVRDQGLCKMPPSVLNFRQLTWYI